MQVFVTGGSGHVCTNTIPKLIAAGHRVTALSRTPASDAALQALGATPIRGTTADLAVLRTAARDADAVLHAAFNNGLIGQPGGFDLACAEDRAAITAIGDTLLAAGGARILLYTCGTLSLLGPDEDSEHDENPDLPRWKSELLVREYGSRGLRAIVVRLPPVVHGPGNEHAFITGQVALARDKGWVGIVGTGDALWPSAHVDDVATLMVLALEQGTEGVLHAVDEEGIPTRDIAGLVARRLGLETRSLKPEEALEQMGFIGMILSKGARATAIKTKARTGWQPKGYGLLQELEGYNM